MVDGQSWRRRRVLASLAGMTAVLGAPAILRAAPSGKPVRVGGTLSLTGFLAQTALVHKIAAEIMVEEINDRNGFLGRPIEYVLLDDQYVIRAVSRPFAFVSREIEFCAGLARRGGDLLVSFGVDDQAAMLGVVDLDGVLGLLEPVESLPKAGAQW